MPKLSIRYVCQDCGAVQAKWIGRCPSCGGWNSLTEEVERTSHAKIATGSAFAGGPLPVALDKLSNQESPRLGTGLAELDRVLGGGIVEGSLVLIGGEPGIGKSTLLLQACEGCAKKSKKILYVSGEESLQQISLRAKRLGIQHPAIHLLAETRLELILSTAERFQPDLLVLDSIQTLVSSELPAGAGSLLQIRECTLRLMELAKNRALSIFLIGHVTKEGGLAGPKVLEHLVDTVLTFEGEKHHPFRVLRAAKNRFGSTQEIGLFEIAGQGLAGVENPSAYLFQKHVKNPEGSVAFASLEGSRPMLVEVQALVTSTHYGTPQRSSTGLDPWRLSLLYAVLEKRCGVLLYNHDIFVSVAGGLKVEEPAIDLAVACAVVSSHRNQAVPPDWVVFGEIGLGGELRPVQQAELRLKEAARMGCRQALFPMPDKKEMERLKNYGLALHPVRDLSEALNSLWA